MRKSFLDIRTKGIIFFSAPTLGADSMQQWKKMEKKEAECVCERFSGCLLLKFSPSSSSSSWENSGRGNTCEISMVSGNRRAAALESDIRSSSSSRAKHPLPTASRYSHASSHATYSPWHFQAKKNSKPEREGLSVGLLHIAGEGPAQSGRVQGRRLLLALFMLLPWTFVQHFVASALAHRF